MYGWKKSDVEEKEDFKASHHIFYSEPFSYIL